ncbi:aldehyde dehydrogenase family protein [Rhodobacteraceae bacterium nBUS_22]
MAEKEGAKILYHPGRQGALLPPIVVDYVPHDSELVMEETFGPVIPIVRVPDNDDEVMSISNSTDFGLSSGVCTNDLNRAIAYINGLDVGTCNIGPVAELCRSFNRILCTKGEYTWETNQQQNLDRKLCA